MIRETRGESTTDESSENQSGSGKRIKRVLVKVLPINSPRLDRRKVKFTRSVRQKQIFIPKIWEKL
ncbi:unnamed protein product [Meloidogyne enterolobii]|uniref:Uncharacterized protein n=1 Tax=Meloidogyne enterolobii TaxID=390850 RepID=A0ACB1AU00_MELEN